MVINALKQFHIKKSLIKLEMRDFCNVAERDCIRLIVAQDLKENGIDLDSQHHSQQQQQKHQKDHTINKSNISTTHDPVINY
jgi:hypothetical protein